MSLTAAFPITPGSLPWLASALAFQAVDGNITKIASGSGNRTDGSPPLLSINGIFGNVHVGDLIVLIADYAVDSAGTTNLTVSDEFSNTWVPGPQQMYQDINGNYYSEQQFYTIVTSNDGFLGPITTSQLTDFGSDVLFAGLEWVQFRSDTAITLDAMAQNSGISASSYVTVSPSSPTPTVVASTLVDGLTDTPFPPGITLGIDPPFSGFLYSGGSLEAGNEFQNGSWAGQYIVFNNTPPPPPSPSPITSIGATMPTLEITRDLDADWGDSSTFFITQDQPFPFTLRGIVLRMSYDLD